MKSYVPLIRVLLLSIVGLTIGCSKEQAAEVQVVDFDQLLTSPEQYNGQDVTIEGFFFHGFEIVVLSEYLEYSGYAEGHLVPKGKMLWIEGGISKEVYDRLYKQEMMGPTERYGKIMLKGKFEYGGKYGHLGAYSSQIVPSEVEFLLWSPPGKQ